MVLCTGRTPEDTPAQPSFRARSNTEPSRLDHALVDCGLFPAVQSSKVGAHRHKSDHFSMELQLLLTMPDLPTAPPSPPAPTPPECGTTGSGGSMHMPSCQGRARPLSLLLAASAHQHSLSATGSAHLELADAQFRSAVDTAAQAASLRRKQPGTGRQPPHLSCYPWRNPRCLMLQSQLRQAKLLWSRSPHVRLLERGTSLTFASAAANSISVRLWTSSSCSKPTHASFTGSSPSKRAAAHRAA